MRKIAWETVCSLFAFVVISAAVVVFLKFYCGLEIWMAGVPVIFFLAGFLLSSIYGHALGYFYAANQYQRQIGSLRRLVAWKEICEKFLIKQSEDLIRQRETTIKVFAEENLRLANELSRVMGSSRVFYGKEEAEQITGVKEEKPKWLM